MQEIINETEAKQIALEYVKTKEPGAQTEIKSAERQNTWVMETQTKETNGTQYANVTLSETGEIKDYKKTKFKNIYWYGIRGTRVLSAGEKQIIRIEYFFQK